MSIEIKELVIRSSVRIPERRDDGPIDGGGALAKEEILAECRRMVREIVSELRER